MTETNKIEQSEYTGRQTGKSSFSEMVSDELQRLVGQLLEFTEKLDNSTTPQGKNLYGKKVKKIQTKVTRLARLASSQK